MRTLFALSASGAGLLVGVISIGSQALSQSSVGMLAVSQATGSAPLMVTFQGHANGATFFGGVTISFGDGSSKLFCPPGMGCRETIVTHTYKAPGRYTAKLVGNGEPSAKAIASTVVTVR